MVERIAQRMRNRRTPDIEFLPGRCASSDESFVHAVGAHRPPFVVIAAEPDFREIGKPVVRQNLLRSQMAMVVIDGLCFREAMVQIPRRSRLQQEVVVNKGFHRREVKMGSVTAYTG